MIRVPLPAVISRRGQGARHCLTFLAVLSQASWKASNLRWRALTVRFWRVGAAGSSSDAPERATGWKARDRFARFTTPVMRWPWTGGGAERGPMHLREGGGEELESDPGKDRGIALSRSSHRLGGISPLRRYGAEGRNGKNLRAPAGLPLSAQGCHDGWEPPGAAERSEPKVAGE